MGDGNRRLVWHGMFLFLIGLITGLLETRFTNIRMALAAHLEGVMNGTFLVALGAIWAQLRLSPGLERAALRRTVRRVCELRDYHAGSHPGHRSAVADNGCRSPGSSLAGTAGDHRLRERRPGNHRHLAAGAVGTATQRRAMIDAVGVQEAS